MSERTRSALLCLACGEVTWEDEWTYWIRDWNADPETGALVPAPDGTEDPVTRCPACGWDHVDDDSNPGIQDGPGLSAERERLLPDYADSWIYRWQEVAKERAAKLEALAAESPTLAIERDAAHWEQLAERMSPAEPPAEAEPGDPCTCPGGGYWRDHDCHYQGCPASGISQARGARDA